MGRSTNNLAWRMVQAKVYGTTHAQSLAIRIGKAKTTQERTALILGNRIAGPKLRQRGPRTFRKLAKGDDTKGISGTKAHAEGTVVWRTFGVQRKKVTPRKRKLIEWAKRKATTWDKAAERKARWDSWFKRKELDDLGRYDLPDTLFDVCVSLGLRPQGGTPRHTYKGNPVKYWQPSAA